MRVGLAILLLSGVALGQATSPATPQLPITTQIALATIRDQRVNLEQQKKVLEDTTERVAQEIKVAFPGFHLNTQTLGVEKDSVPVVKK